MPAAIGDAYATAAEYRAGVTKSSSADDATVITPLLGAISRLIDRECSPGVPGLATRHFTKDASVVTRVYDATGGCKLHVDDIATLTGLIVKVDLDGDYAFTGSDETLTIDTHFWTGPANVDKQAEPEPWTFLELRPDNAVLGIWPWQKRSVQVTAIFGWPAVPSAIKNATIAIARELRDMEESGMTLALEQIDQAVNLSRTAFSLVQMIKAQYGRQVMIR
jgi:hypothetical protein